MRMDIEVKAHEEIKYFRSLGFDLEQIKDSVCDGAFLKESGMDQDIAEEIYSLLGGNAESAVCYVDK